MVATRHTASLPDAHPVQLIPPRDIDALAAGLLELLNNPAMLTQLGADGRAFKISTGRALPKRIGWYPKNCIVCNTSEDERNKVVIQEFHASHNHLLVAGTR